MTDAHLHLQDHRLAPFREQIIKDMKATGIKHCVVNGTSPDDWEQVSQLAKQHPDLIKPSFGLHPWKEIEKGWEEKLLHYLDTHPNAGIGECGLDRWMKNYDIEKQKQVFLTQLNIATEKNLPLSIHCLKAWGVLLEILETNPLPKRGFLLHSYNGSTELVPRLAKLGAYFSLSGYFLHPRKQQVRETFQQIPPDRLLLETDAPDMLPPDEAIKHSLPDQLNHPANLLEIYRTAPSFLDTSLTCDNFKRLFGYS